MDGQPGEPGAKGEPGASPKGEPGADAQGSNRNVPIKFLHFKFQYHSV